MMHHESLELILCGFRDDTYEQFTARLPSFIDLRTSIVMVDLHCQLDWI